MTKFEIIQSYRQSRDKNKQIGIIAELADMDKQEIVQILIDAGEIAGVKTKKDVKSTGKNKVDWTPELTADLVRMQDEGLGNAEIAERLGVDRKAVANKLHRLKTAVPEINEPGRKTGVEKRDAALQDGLDKLSAILDCLHAVDMELLRDRQNISFLIASAVLCVDDMQKESHCIKQ